MDTPKLSSPRLTPPRVSSLALSLIASLFVAPLTTGCDDPKPLTMTLSASEPLALGLEARLTATLSESSDVTWRLSARPSGSLALLTPLDLAEGDPSATFTPDVLGRYEVTASSSKDERSVSERLELMVSCAPPQWRLALSSPQGEPTQGASLQGVVGRSLSLRAELSSPNEEGCPELEPLPPQLSWALLSKPSASSAQLEPVGELTRRLTPDALGDYLVRASVTDALGRRDSQALTVSASCGASAPEVSAGARFLNAEGDEALASEGAWLVGRPLSLQLSSSDPDASCVESTPSLSWRWRERPAESEAALSDASASAPWFTPDVPGRYVLEASATDPQGLSGSALVSVEVSACGDASPLIASLSASPAPSLLSASVLSAEVSDADADPACVALRGEERLSYRWLVQRAPTTSRALPLPTLSAQPTFTPDVPGAYTLELEVSDSAGHTTSERLSFEVEACGSSAPRAQLTSSANPVALNQPFSLEVSATDADLECGAEDEVSLSWRLLSAPAGAPTITLPATSPLATRLSLSVSVAGRYTFEVTPTDLAGHVGEASVVSVEALDCGSFTPSLEALSLTQGSTQDSTQGSRASLLPLSEGRPLNDERLSASLLSPVSLSVEVSDPNHACLEALNAPLTERVVEYAWRLERAPRDSALTSPEGEAARGASLELSFDVPGVYELSLSARFEGDERASEARFSVEVSACGAATPQLTWLDPLAGELTVAGVGAPITLEVSATDADEAADCELPQPLTYAWRWRELPTSSALSSTSLERFEGASAWVSPDVSGLYVLEVSATDPQGHRASQTARLEVGGCGLSTPELTSVQSVLTQGLTSAQVGSPVQLTAQWRDADLEPPCPSTSAAPSEVLWRLVSAPAQSQAQLQNSTLASAWFTPDAPGTYELEVSVTDSTGRAALETLTVEVSDCGSATPVMSLNLPLAPLAVGERALLSVSVSDADDACLSAPQAQVITWRLVEAPAGAASPFTPANQPSLTFSATHAGRYVISAHATDARGLTSAPAFGEVLVEACGDLPPELANARVEGALSAGSSVTLRVDATNPNSRCGASGALSYAWRLLSAPEGSVSADRLSSVSAQRSPSLTLDVAGDYEAEVTVSDERGRRSSASVQWQVSPCGGSTPVASARLEPVAPLVGELVRLIGEGSDADSDPACGEAVSLSYQWRVEQLPAGYSEPLNLTGAAPWLRLSLPGDYAFSLVVSDQDGHVSAPARLSFSVADCGATPPQLNVASLSLTPASPQVGERAVLSASTTDADSACGGVTEASVRWRVVSAPSGATLTLGSGAQPELIASAGGIYEVEATPVGADGLTGEPRRFSFEVSGCGGFTPQLSLRSALSADPNNPLTSAPLTSPPSALLLMASTSDADEVAPCALTQAREVSWRLIGAPAGDLPALSPALNLLGEQATGASVSLTPIQEGRYTFEATVRDATGRASTGSLSVELTSCGERQPQLAPISLSSPGPFVGERLTLSSALTPPAAGCEPSSAEAHTWSWRLTKRPASSAASLNAPTLASPSLLIDVAGEYEVSVRAMSPSGQLSEEQRVSFVVASCGDQAPVITSAPQAPANPQLNELLSFSVAGVDPDAGVGCGAESPFSAHWRLIKRPAGSVASLSRDVGAEVGFTPDVAGEYSLEVRLIEALAQADGAHLESAPSTLTFSVGDCGGLAPQALISALAPQPLAPASSLTLDLLGCEGAPFVQLDASASRDLNDACGAADPLTYQWEVTQLSPGVEVSLSEPAAERLNLSLSGVAPSETGEVTVRLTVTNREGLSSSASARLGFTSLTPPQTLNINPSFLCAEATNVTFTGDHFYTYEGALPRVLVGGQLVAANGVAGCTSVLPGQLERCTSLDVTIPGGLSADLYSASVRNPYPIGCDDLTPPRFFVISAPTIDSFSPRPICRGQFDGRLNLTGAGFVRDQPQGQETAVSVNGVPAVAPLLNGCEVANGSLELCTQASFELPASQKDVADLDVTLSNPNPGGCDPASLSVTERFVQSEPPIIDDISPLKICDQGGSLNLIGDHFEPGVTVSFDSQLAELVEVVNGELEVRATWSETPNPRFVPGRYPVVATNATGCATTSAQEVLVTEGPVPFFVDPPIVYNGITLQATVYLGNLEGGNVTRALISQGQAAPIELDFSYAPQSPNRLNLVLPQGLPPGTYDLTLYDDVACPGTTNGLLEVTDQLTVSLTDLTPPFAWASGVTPITAYAQAGAGFVPTPRAYLSPSQGTECVQDAECGAASPLCVQGRCASECASSSECAQGFACSGGACVPQAAELRAVSIRSEVELQGTVTSGFAPGRYDLVVVNPNGSVGVLSEAMKINVNPPPKISAVSPGSWEVNQAALPVQVSGANFSAPVVTATCVTSGVTSTYNLNVVSSSATLIDLTIDTSVLNATSVCSLRVLNADESYDDFSPLTGTSPSGNFVTFSAGADLPAGLARRLSALTYAQIPNGAPALFLLGGDLGAASLAGAEALADTYTAQLDPFGNLGAWERLPTNLPSGRTRTHAVTLGRFIYLAGGLDASGQPSDEVLRAELLDPLYVPEVSSVDFTFVEGQAGLDTGVYYYRVSAVYGANDPNNPSGESLPSEPQPVFIPAVQGRGVHLTLQWTGLDDAVAYRVYRSPSPNLLLGQEELLAELPANTLSLVDDGLMATTPNTATLQQGILGEWAVVAQLNSPRQDHAVTLAPDPVDPDVTHLYVVGGLVSGNPTDSYELISINTADERAHVLSAPTEVLSALSAPRSRLSALTATPKEASFLLQGSQPKDVVLYLLGGPETQAVDAAVVAPGGLLTSFLSVDNMQRSRSGYAAAIANNNLVSVCGQGGSASATAEKGAVCGVACDPNVEDITKWSSLGNTGVRSCVDPAYTSARGFFYLIGGGDGSGDISLKVDIALLGGTP